MLTGTRLDLTVYSHISSQLAMDSGRPRGLGYDPLMDWHIWPGQRT